MRECYAVPRNYPSPGKLRATLSKPTPPYFYTSSSSKLSDARELRVSTNACEAGKEEQHKVVLPTLCMPAQPYDKRLIWRHFICRYEAV